MTALTAALAVGVGIHLALTLFLSLRYLEGRGVEFTVAKTAIPGIWQWQFRIGEQIKTGRTETKIDLLAIRRVQLRIDRELRAIRRKTA